MSEQIKVTVTSKAEEKRTELFHDRNKTLLHTLREGGISLPSLCGGLGKCGRCLVRFCGYAPFPTQTDRAVLHPQQLRDGYRLACTVKPLKDCKVTTAFIEERQLDILTASSSPDMPEESEGGADQGSHDRKKDRKTVAVADIGTTTIAMQLLEAGSGYILDTYTCLNPQKIYGTDVISRIRAGMEGNGEILRQLVRDALVDGIRKMTENVENGGTCRLEHIFLSANTVMGHLFMGYPVEPLGKSPFMPMNIKRDGTNWLGVPTILVPGISAFVGGDIVSGLYACGLCQQEKRGKWLFLDLGTNAEMVMGNGNQVAATAAAAGPAFEGRGTGGMSGTERISAVASLLEGGIIDETGLMMEPYFETGIEMKMMPGETSGIRARIFQEDVRDIQMAKAAVRAGIHFLMKHLDIERYEEIEKVYIAGGFGFYLDKKAAAGIGLIPLEWMEKAETVGNTSLAGIRLLERERAKQNGGKENILDLDILDGLESFAGKVEAFQLAEEPEFDKIYVDYMNFDIQQGDI